ncbi:MAG: hypothetical protein VX427_08770, partial [Acidobacteriota bacterium]|nr:hypothetical protein [Acidobacteriota bacterium]
MAEQRHCADVARLEAEVAELATAEARHRGEIARVETEAVELSDAATRDAQATAEARSPRWPPGL